MEWRMSVSKINICVEANKLHLSVVCARIKCQESKCRQKLVYGNIYENAMHICKHKGKSVMKPWKKMNYNWYRIYEGGSINKVTRRLTCVMFLISFKFPSSSEQVEHCSLSQTLDRASYQPYCRNISCKMAGLAKHSQTLRCIVWSDFCD
jgi:hypothetical protein